MRKLFTVAVLSLLSAVVVHPSSAAPKAKAGAKCTKVNSTQIVGAKKFTCVKQGTKTIWDKGKVNLFTPVFTARAESNNFEWNVLVTNYPGAIGEGLEFTYFYSLDQRPFVLYWTKKSQREKISIDSPFNIIRIKVVVSDGGNQEKASEVFEKSFRDVVTPPNSSQPDVVYSPQIDQSELPFLTSVSGVQWRNEPGVYVGDKPKARVLLRWPKQADPSIRGYIVTYENTQTITPPCDLQQALCDGPKRFDSTIYKQVINQPSSELVVLDNLEINSSYLIGLVAVSGGKTALEQLPTPENRRSIFVRTSGETVPGPPTGVIVGTVSGNIKIVSSMVIDPGYKLKIIAIGGKFGTSTEVAVLTGPQEVLIPAPLGFYQIISRLVTPSGINGDTGSMFSVTVG
jgi:hypothetical protein